jgi:hypothetical protein
VRHFPEDRQKNLPTRIISSANNSSSSPQDKNQQYEWLALFIDVDAFAILKQHHVNNIEELLNDVVPFNAAGLLALHRLTFCLDPNHD